MRRFSWLAALFLIPASPVFAAPAVAPAATVAATVEAVQAPAWLDRNGVSYPLGAGMEVRNGDVLRTGPGARAYVMLAEGSRVKLGESARLVLHSRSLKPKTFFRGALDVVTGAFRYTTGLASKARRQELAIRVGTATIGIRGTDIWGRSNAEGDLVALIDGRIEITRAGQVTELAQAMTYYDAPRGKEAEVKALSDEVFRPLARQTEIEPGDGAARAKGMWKVVAGVAGDNESALELYDRVRAAGFAAKLRPRAAEGGWRYEVLLAGFANADEARVLAARLKALIGLEATVVR